MANNNDRLVVAYFSNKAAAEGAVDSIKSWDKADDDIKLGAIAIMTLNDKGELHADEVGQRSTRQDQCRQEAESPGGLLRRLHHERSFVADKKIRKDNASTFGDSKWASRRSPAGSGVRRGDGAGRYLLCSRPFGIRFAWPISAAICLEETPCAISETRGFRP